MKKIVLNDAALQIDQNSLLIQRKEGFLVLGNTNSFAGFRSVQSILNRNLGHEDDSVLENREEYQKFVSRVIKEKKALEPAAVLISRADISKIEMTTLSDVTCIAAADYSNSKDISSDIVILVNRNLDNESLMKLFTVCIEAKLAVLYDLNVLEHSTLMGQQAGYDNMLLACKASESQYDSDLTEIQALIRECVRESLTKLLHKVGYPQTILDFIEQTGVTIEDLLEAGMELVVGVEKSEDLYTKLHQQILKALKDINVIALIMAGIRLEEDLGRHRIRGVNVDDDPAYLYSDEVLGMAIANQIAGTKAIFNFKRYDEEKPGVLSTLGPVLDDVFAGLIAGCMSKMFEE